MARGSENEVTTYPNPFYIKLIIADAYCVSESKARIVEDIVKNHYDKMDQHRREKLLATYEKMTAQERKYPKKIRQE